MFSWRPFVAATAHEGLAVLSLAVSACDPVILLGDAVDGPAMLDGRATEPLVDGGAAGSFPDRTAPEPVPGDLVWTSDHETGDFSDWEAGGLPQGGQYYWGTGYGLVLDGVGRQASRGLELGIDTSGSEPSHGARVYRRVQPEPAFYSAWFRLNETHAVSDWWAIFLFHARDDSLSLETYTSLWDVRIVAGADGTMTLQFYDHDTGQSTPAESTGTIDVDRWFELQAYLDYRPPDGTHLVIRMDGAPVLDMSGLRTHLETNVFWVIGNGGSGLTPPRSTMYVDDAAVASVRVTP